jgi:uncharacterized membrane protein YfcA
LNGLFKERFHLAIMGAMSIAILGALIIAMFWHKELRGDISIALISALNIVIGFFFGQRSPRRTSDS